MKKPAISLISDPDPGAAQIKGLGPQSAVPGVCHQTQTVFNLPGGGVRDRGHGRWGTETVYQSSLTSAVLNHANHGGGETV